jgi:hypothetical protein
MKSCRARIACVIAVACTFLVSQPASAFVIDYIEILLQGAKVGYIDTAGRVVIEPKFERAGAFSQRRAAVRLDRKWGYIDTAGKLVIPARYAQAEAFSEGLAAVSVLVDAPKDVAREGPAKVHRWGYVDASGKEIVAPQYEQVGPFHDGRAVFKKDGKFGYLGPNGAVVVEPTYSWAGDFCEKMAAVFVDGKAGYVDTAGTVVIKPQFAGCNGTGFSGGLAPVQVEVGLGTQWAYIDRTGKFVIEPAYDSAYPIRDGLALVEKNQKFGFIDKTGAVVIPIKYWHAAPFSEGLAHVEERSNETGHWGFIDTAGQAVIHSKRIGSSFHGGRAVGQVHDNADKDGRPMGSWGFYDKTGVLKIPATLEWAGEFSEGLAPFATGCNQTGVGQALDADLDGWGGRVKSNTAPAKPGL